MSDLWFAFRAETAKLRRTLALWLVLAIPLIGVTLQFFLLLDRGRPGDASLWPSLVKGILSVWAVFLLPLFIALETALVNGLEHTSEGWRQMFALPVRRSAVYGAKIIVATGIVFAAFLVVTFGTAFAGAALHALRPELNMAGGIPWRRLLNSSGGCFTASLFIVVIHTWISARFRGFPLPLGVGIGATFLAVFATSARWGPYYPWLLPLNSLFAERAPTALVLGLVGAVAFAVLMLLDLRRRDVL